MSGSTKMFIRGFLVIGGAVFIFLGLIAKDIVSLLLAVPFLVIGVIIVFVTLYWWYKDYQRG